VIINRDDEARMNDAAVRKSVAAAIARGVRRCLP
jgi:N-acetylmuramoyl-L-alanine amidase